MKNTPHRFPVKVNDIVYPKISNHLGALKDSHCLLVVGDANSGQSDSLNNWLLRGTTYYTKNLVKIWLGEPMVPFQLSVNKLPLDNIDGWSSLWQAFLIENKGITDALIDDPSTVEQVFNSGQALLLIDGLDKIVDDAQREKVERAILEGLSKYPLCKSIINFLPGDISQSPFYKAGYPVFDIEPLNADEIKTIIDHWGLTTKKPTNELIMALNRQDKLSKLSSSSLLLEMIFHTYSSPARPRHYAKSGAIPEKQTEIIQDIVEVYLTDAVNACDKSKESPQFDTIDLGLWLSEIALALQDKRNSGALPLIRKQDIVDSLKEYLLSDRQIDLAISCMSDFIVPAGQDQCGFINVDLLEHFAAAGLKMEADIDTSALVDRQHTIENPLWEKCWRSFFEQVESFGVTRYYTELLDYKQDSEERLVMM